MIEPTYLYTEGDSRTDPANPDALDELVEITTTGYQAAEQRPLAAFMLTLDQGASSASARQSPVSPSSLLNSRYVALSWLTLFTPSMVEHYGREILLSAPAYHTEELDDGAIVLLCNDKPLDIDTDCQDVADHIDIPTFRELLQQ